MGITHLLANDGFIILNKKLVLELGLDEALMLGELAAEQNYWEQSEKMIDGFFYSTVENVQNATGMSDYRQRECLKRLEARGIVNVKVQGVPPKRYIKINEEPILKIFEFQFSKNSRIKSQNFQELNLKKFETNSNNINSNKNNNKCVCGRHRNVLLTEEELNKLKANCTHYQEYIERLSISMFESGKNYKDHYGRIWMWYKEDKRNGKIKEEQKSSYDLAEQNKRCLKKPEYKKK